MTAITKLVFVGLCLCLCAVNALAQHEHASRLDAVDVVYEPTNSTEELLTRYSQVHDKPSAYWQLTDDEWVRYETLKEKSPWASWENHGSPLAVLSYYAESREEKRRYARIEAELDTWRQHSVVEFQTLYDKERSIVHARYVEFIKDVYPSVSSIKAQDKLRLFVNAGPCDASCRSVVSRVLGTQAKTDIYVLGANGKDEAIFSWAEAAAIPVERVKTKEVTLNHENGLLKYAAEEAGLPMPRIPVLFKKGANGILQVVPL